MQLLDWEAQAVVSSLELSVPTRDLHCWSREVHWPEAQVKPAPSSPHVAPSSVLTSLGQVAAVPAHVSSGSQVPVLARHTVPEEANLHWLVQQSSLPGSQTELAVYLHVLASQQLLSLHPSSPPQSHSSSSSTMPLPHWLPVMVGTPRLSLRHVVLTLLRPMEEQMFPILQGEKSVIPVPVDGFMMNSPSALQLDEVSGQHFCMPTVPSEHVVCVQSWNAPKV